MALGRWRVVSVLRSIIALVLAESLPLLQKIIGKITDRAMVSFQLLHGIAVTQQFFGLFNHLENGLINVKTLEYLF